MNNGMKETELATADLAEVDPTTFMAFLLYTQALSKESGRATQNVNNAIPVAGPLTVSLLDAGHSEYFCHGCSEMTRLAFSQSLPWCQECLDGKTVHNNLTTCIMAGCYHNKAANRCRGMLCDKCWKGLKTAADADIFVRVPTELSEELSVFRDDVPMLAKEIMEAMGKQSSTANLGLTDTIDLVRLAVFADAYGMAELRKITTLRLFEVLAFSHQAPARVTELLIYIYANTPDSAPDTPLASRHTLRRMLAMYVAYHTDRILYKPAEITDLMRSANDFGADLFMANSLLRAGKLGKGW